MNHSPWFSDGEEDKLTIQKERSSLTREDEISGESEARKPSASVFDAGTNLLKSYLGSGIHEKFHLILFVSLSFSYFPLIHSIRYPQSPIRI
jgi:hypothetical protein